MKKTPKTSNSTLTSISQRANFPTTPSKASTSSDGLSDSLNELNQLNPPPAYTVGNEIKATYASTSNASPPPYMKAPPKYKKKDGNVQLFTDADSRRAPPPNFWRSQGIARPVPEHLRVSQLGPNTRLPALEVAQNREILRRLRRFIRR